MKFYAFADEASPFIDGQIKAMKENDIDGLEIRNVDNVNIADITNEKATEVKKNLNDAGLKVFSIGSPIGKTDIEKDDFNKELEKFRHILELAEIMGAENIRLFSFYIPEDSDADSYKNEVIDRLGRYLDIAEGSNVVLCHENEKGIYGSTPERCLEIHKAHPKMEAIFDPANYIQCGVDTLHAWDTVKQYVRYLHIKDALADGNIVPAGKGIGSIPHILKEFVSMGGDSLSVEPHLAVFSGLAELEKAGDKSLIGVKYRYSSSEEAFSAAVSAIKNIAKNIGEN